MHLKPRENIPRIYVRPRPYVPPIVDINQLP